MTGHSGKTDAKPKPKERHENARTKDGYEFAKLPASYSNLLNGCLQTILSLDFLLKLCTDVQEIFAAEPTLLEVPKPVIIVGDIHGQYDDLQRILALPFVKETSAYNMKRFLFLGDYVDRGAESLPCIEVLFRFKLKSPKSYFLLRGNHESRLVNKQYGFREELIRSYDEKQGMKAWEALNTVFDHMPLSALIDGSILCMHGGLSNRLNSLDDIRKIKRPISDLLKNELARDLLWSDPLTGAQSFLTNDTRGVSVCFGEKQIDKICKSLKISMIIRGHQMMLNGFNCFKNRRLLTVFSAPRYCIEKNSSGAVCLVHKKLEVSILILAPGYRQYHGEDFFRKEYKQKQSEQCAVTDFHVPPEDEEQSDTVLLDGKASSTRSKTVSERVRLEASKKSQKE